MEDTGIITWDSNNSNYCKNDLDLLFLFFHSNFDIISVSVTLFLKELGQSSIRGNILLILTACLISTDERSKTNLVL